MKILYRNDESMKDSWFFLVEFKGGEVVWTGNMENDLIEIVGKPYKITSGGEVVWTGNMENPERRMKKGEKAIKHQANRTGAPVSYTKISDLQAEKILRSNDPEETIKEIYCNMI